MMIRINIGHPYYYRYIDIDPLHPPRAVPDKSCRFSYDQTHEDALEIIEKLKNAMTANDVRTVIWEAFHDFFMDGINGSG